MAAIALARLALLNLLALRVQASLYPTVPVQHSTLHGGQWNELRWKDSGEQPTLDDIGRVDIQLFVDRGEAQATHLTTLATDVDPSQRRQDVFIPSDVYINGQNFFIRFRSMDPPLSFWTADFAMDGLTGSPSSGASGNGTASPSEKVPNTNGSDLQQASQTQSGAQDQGAGGEAKNGVVTVTMEMPSASPTPTSTAGSSDGTERANAVGAVSNDARRAAMVATGGLRNVRFNLVFVLFPALLGILMAL